MTLFCSVCARKRNVNCISSHRWTSDVCHKSKWVHLIKDWASHFHVASAVGVQCSCGFFSHPPIEPNSKRKGSRAWLNGSKHKQCEHTFLCCFAEVVDAYTHRHPQLPRITSPSCTRKAQLQTYKSNPTVHRINLFHIYILCFCCFFMLWLVRQTPEQNQSRITDFIWFEKPWVC